MDEQDLRLKAAEIAGQIVQAGIGGMTLGESDKSAPEKVFGRIFDAVYEKIKPEN